MGVQRHGDFQCMDDGGQSLSIAPVWPVVLTRVYQLDRIQDADIRQPSVHRQDLTWVTDYLIGCHNASSPIGGADNDLCLFAGSNECVVRLVITTVPPF